MTSEITFECDRDMVGATHGVYREEPGRKVVRLSPAMFSLLEGPEKSSLLEGLKVVTDDGIKWVFDLGAR